MHVGWERDSGNGKLNDFLLLIYYFKHIIRTTTIYFYIQKIS